MESSKKLMAGHNPITCLTYIMYTFPIKTMYSLAAHKSWKTGYNRGTHSTEWLTEMVDLYNVERATATV